MRPEWLSTHLNSEVLHSVNLSPHIAQIHGGMNCFPGLGGNLGLWYRRGGKFRDMCHKEM